MRALFVLSLLTLSACSCEPTKPPKLLATVDGCKVYEIYTGYRFIYTTTCPGEANWDEQQGKIIQHQTVQTRRSK